MNLEEIIKSEKSIVKYPKKVYFASSSNFITLLWERPEFDLHIVNLAINSKLGNANKVSEIKFTNNLNLRNLAYNDNVVDVTYSSNIPTYEFLVQNDDNDTFTCYIANAFWGENSKIYCYGNFSRCFENCSQVTLINEVANFDTSNVTNMSFLFERCYSLRQIDVSNFDTQNTTTMLCMFRDCKNVEELDVRNFNFDKCSNIAYMFSSCRKIKSLDLRNFNTTKCNSLYCLFSHCVTLKRLDLTSFDTRNIVNFSYIFFGCFNLQYVKLSDNFVTNKATSFLATFDQCGLISINLQNFTSNLVTSFESMFFGIVAKRIFSNTFNLASFPQDDDENVKVFELATKLVGGNGTRYNIEHTDIEYARVDGENGLPGYFTDPADAIKITIINVDNEGYTDEIYLCVGDTYTIPTLEGFTAVVTDNNGNTYNDGDTITINQYITLTFVWTAVNN